ncbi:hypothetical protein GO730_10980 [Spirosoma sp. HMF3257]|uniref:hypothetical protein n=1 Tax=Spirosoma telluris TaxID=2183553 RepID=UPI0011B943EE|nr:hypothetical protein [Spirosoma telluris]
MLFILSTAWRQGQGQSPSLAFQRLSLQQGLAANYTVAMTQDKPGFVWIATVRGLTRFDGLRCKTFTNQAGNPGHYRTVLFVMCLPTKTAPFGQERRRD